MMKNKAQKRSTRTALPVSESASTSINAHISTSAPRHKKQHVRTMSSVGHRNEVSSTGSKTVTQKVDQAITFAIDHTTNSRSSPRPSNAARIVGSVIIQSGITFAIEVTRTSESDATYAVDWQRKAATDRIGSKSAKSFSHTSTTAPAGHTFVIDLISNPKKHRSSTSSISLQTYGLDTLVSTGSTGQAGKHHAEYDRGKLSSRQLTYYQAVREAQVKQFAIINRLNPSTTISSSIKHHSAKLATRTASSIKRPTSTVTSAPLRVKHSAAFNKGRLSNVLYADCKQWKRKIRDLQLTIRSYQSSLKLRLHRLPTSHRPAPTHLHALLTTTESKMERPLLSCNQQASHLLHQLHPPHACQSISTGSHSSLFLALLLFSLQSHVPVKLSPRSRLLL